MLGRKLTIKWGWNLSTTRVFAWKVYDGNSNETTHYCGHAAPKTTVASAPWRRIFHTPSMSYDHELFHVRPSILHDISQSRDAEEAWEKRSVILGRHKWRVSAQVGMGACREIDYRPELAKVRNLDKCTWQWSRAVYLWKYFSMNLNTLGSPCPALVIAYAGR